MRRVGSSLLTKIAAGGYTVIADRSISTNKKPVTPAAKGSKAKPTRSSKVVAEEEKEIAELMSSLGLPTPEEERKLDSKKGKCSPPAKKGKCKKATVVVAAAEEEADPFDFNDDEFFDEIETNVTQGSAQGLVDQAYLDEFMKVLANEEEKKKAAALSRKEKKKTKKIRKSHPNESEVVADAASAADEASPSASSTTSAQQLLSMTAEQLCHKDALSAAINRLRYYIETNKAEEGAATAHQHHHDHGDDDAIAEMGYSAAHLTNDATIVAASSGRSKLASSPSPSAATAMLVDDLMPVSDDSSVLPLPPSPFSPESLPPFPVQSTELSTASQWLLSPMSMSHPKTVLPISATRRFTLNTIPLCPIAQRGERYLTDEELARILVEPLDADNGTTFMVRRSMLIKDGAEGSIRLQGGGGGAAGADAHHVSTSVSEDSKASEAKGTEETSSASSSPAAPTAIDESLLSADIINDPVAFEALKASLKAKRKAEDAKARAAAKAAAAPPTDVLQCTLSVYNHRLEPTPKDSDDEVKGSGRGNGFDSRLYLGADAAATARRGSSSSTVAASSSSTSASATNRSLRVKTCPLYTFYVSSQPMLIPIIPNYTGKHQQPKRAGESDDAAVKDGTENEKDAELSFTSRLPKSLKAQQSSSSGPEVSSTERSIRDLFAASDDPEGAALVGKRGVGPAVVGLVNSSTTNSNHQSGSPLSPAVDLSKLKTPEEVLAALGISPTQPDEGRNLADVDDNEALDATLPSTKTPPPPQPPLRDLPLTPEQMEMLQAAGGGLLHGNGAINNFKAVTADGHEYELTGGDDGEAYNDGGDGDDDDDSLVFTPEDEALMGAFGSPHLFVETVEEEGAPIHKFIDDSEAFHSVSTACVLHDNAPLYFSGVDPKAIFRSVFANGTIAMPSFEAIREVKAEMERLDKADAEAELFGRHNKGGLDEPNIVDADIVAGDEVATPLKKQQRQKGLKTAKKEPRSDKRKLTGTKEEGEGVMNNAAVLADPPMPYNSFDKFSASRLTSKTHSPSPHSSPILRRPTLGFSPTAEDIQRYIDEQAALKQKQQQQQQNSVDERSNNSMPLTPTAGEQEQCAKKK